MTPYFQSGLYLAATATNLEPGVRYWFVWYGYRSDDDPSPVRYSYTPQPCPASGVLTVRVSAWPLYYYAQGENLARIRSFVALRGSETPVTDPTGQPMCISWDTYEPYSPEACVSP